MARPERIQRYLLLDVMRGVAALWMFSFHVRSYFLPYGRLVHWIAGYGFIGINIFFIISGYSVTASMANALRLGESARGFLYRRCRRIFVPMWFSLIVAAAMPWIHAWLLDKPVNAPYLAWPWWVWPRVATLTQVFFADGPFLHVAFEPINMVLWTLGIEVQFYLVMGLALALRGGRRAWFVLALVSLACLPLTFCPPLYATGLFLPYWPIFALGIGLYALHAHGWTPRSLPGISRRMTTVMMLGGIPILLGILRIEPLTPTMPGFSLAMAAWFWLGLGLKQDLEKAAFSGRLAIRRPARLLLLLGAMSYTIYLLHAPVFPLVADFLDGWINAHSVLFAPLLIGLCITLYYPFHRYCERPFIRPRVRPRPEPGLAGGRRQTLPGGGRPAE